MAAAGLSLLNWLYGYFVLPESLTPENRRKFEWKRANPMGSLMHMKKYPSIAGLLISLILVYVAAHAVQGTWSYYTMEKFDWDSAMVGRSLGVVGVVSALVQGLLIRVLIPKLGKARSVYIGLLLYSIGLVLFAFASHDWMMFVFTVPYCLGGIAGPAIQGLMANEVPPTEQGELQGGLTSIMSATAVVGPILMTTLFSYYTSKENPVYFPGAPMLLGAVLTLISTVLAYRSLAKSHPAEVSVFSKP